MPAQNELLPDREYIVEVEWAQMTTSQTGTAGMHITFVACDGSGSLQHTAYITPGTADFFSRDMRTLGVSDAELRSQAFYEHCGEALKGRKCKITTKSEEYRGKFKTRVGFINQFSNVVNGTPVSLFAAKLMQECATPADGREHQVLTPQDVGTIGKANIPFPLPGRPGTGEPPPAPPWDPNDPSSEPM